jgi:hypothetical protein
VASRPPQRGNRHRSMSVQYVQYFVPDLFIPSSSVQKAFASLVKPAKFPGAEQIFDLLDCQNLSVQNAIRALVV